MFDLLALESIALIACVGMLAGLLSGLLGVGGGIILVPGLYMLFTLLGYTPDALMHVCVGTSLAIIIPTGISSARAHWKRGAVDRDTLKKIAPYLVVGVAVGSIAIRFISGESLTLFFAGMLLVIALLLQIDPEKYRWRTALPAQPEPALAGGVIGFISTLMGIGGASLNVPYMVMNGLTIHRAVATASVMGPVIGLPGMIGFIAAGWHAPDLPPYSLGYINLAAVALIIPFSVLCAPVGVHLAHRFSKTLLRRCFSVFLLIVAVKMGLDAF